MLIVPLWSCRALEVSTCGDKGLDDFTLLGILVKQSMFRQVLPFVSPNTGCADGKAGYTTWFKQG